MKSKVNYYKEIRKGINKDSQAFFLLENIKVIAELIDKNLIIEILISKQVQVLYPQLWVQIIACKMPYYVVPDFDIQKISSLKTNPHIIALAQKNKNPKIENINIENKINLVLDRIQDPGNMGTIIRTANWFGIENIFCSVDCVDMFNNKCIQSAMGSFLNVNVFYTDLNLFLQQHTTLPVYVSSLEGIDIKDVKVSDVKQNKKGYFVVLGNESQGVSKELLLKATEKIKIPQLGKYIDSLNVVVACGIILYTLKQKYK